MKAFFLFLSLLIGSQDSTIIRKYGVFDHATIKRIENLVRNGEMTRSEADSRYVYYLQNNLNRLKKKESVIKSNFQEVGVYDLDKIRNEMLIMDFPIGKIEPSLGGMLRVIHAMKKGENRYKLSPRLKSYFKERLELENYHIDYIMRKSEKIAQMN
ncbi:MAG: hypothetical protein ACJZ1R_07085 [Candidatus Neomarinimicrobiota bacterium]